MAEDQAAAPAPAAPEILPQSGGTYHRQPDGSLVLQKPKATLSDLVAGKQSAAQQTTEPTQE